MASTTKNAIGLTVPGRPSTPCNGAAQHFRRPGDPSKQMTRTFVNGTTISFGENDFIPTFAVDDPFYEQVQSIQVVEEEIREVRREFEEAGFRPDPTIRGSSRATESDEYGDLFDTGSTLHESVAKISLDPPPHGMGASKRAFAVDGGQSTESQSRQYGRPSRRSRRNHNQSQISRFSENKTGTRSSRPLPPVKKVLVVKNLVELSRISHEASNDVAKGHKLDEAIPFQFNSFGASISDASTQSVSVSAARNKEQAATQMSSVQTNRTQKRLEEISQHGCYLKAQRFSSATAARNKRSQITQASSKLIPQPSINVVGQNQESFQKQMAYSDRHFNDPGVAQSIPTIQQRSLMPFPAPIFHHVPFPDPNYYGPVFNMTAMQMDRIMSANGIKLPATYRPDDRYYHGHLHYLVPPVAAVIVEYIDSTNQPPLPLLPCHFMNTMLTPYGVPPYAHMPGLSQGEIHVKECIRHYELMKEVLAVPGYINHGEEPMMWYRILASSHPRSQRPVWHPSVIDLYGKEEQYEHLFMRDVNFRNNNQKGVGRPGNRLNRMRVVPKMEHQERFNLGEGQEYQKTPVMPRNRAESETSIFFPDSRCQSNTAATFQYLGYALKSKRHEEPHPEISPTQTSRGRSTRSIGKKIGSHIPKCSSASDDKANKIASTHTPKKPFPSTEKSSTGNTPLLDFDQKYTEEHGEGDDVDFALRDLGPPTIHGKTFNQAIGFTPSPEKGTGSSAPFGYPMNVLRYFRD